MNNKAIEAILNRHCCREFQREGEIPDEHMSILMESLRWAPSAGNVQPWFFYVVRNRRTRRDLAGAAFGQDFVAEAAVVFVVCADPGASAATYGERGRSLYCLQDAAAAIENVLLAATALGYGSCWVGAFDEDMAREVLGIPRHLRPVALVPVGPGEPIADFPGRKEASEVFEVVE